MDAARLKALLGLSPLPTEGGFFAETYRSTHSTAIYYLLEPGTCSRLHRLTSDEVYHFYLGDPVELLVLRADGTSEVRCLGPALDRGQAVQAVVPAGVWQGARIVSGGAFALLGTTMAPPFSWSGFVAGGRAALTAQYPDRAELIRQLTEPA